MKRRIITYQFAGYGAGEKLSDDPCEFFDDMPPETPEEIILKFQAGGQLADLNRRAVYYDPQELDDYEKDEYACDYVQRYKDFLNAKKREYSQTLSQNAQKETNAPDGVAGVGSSKGATMPPAEEGSAGPEVKQ